jgi:hypothetical protein
MQLRIPLVRIVWVLFVFHACAALAAKKTAKPLTTPDGRPIRMVYVHASSADVAAAARIQLRYDTCLTPASQPAQADAVLQFSVPLPAVSQDSLTGPNIFASPVGPQTLENGLQAPANKDGAQQNTAPQKSASFQCTSGKGGKQCSGSYDLPAGDIADLPQQAEAASSLSGMDVLLTTPDPASQQIWEAVPHKKQSWTDQLRAAVGCPVCPGGHFDRHRYKNYSNWIQQRCKEVLPQKQQAGAQQATFAPSQSAKK